MKMPLMTFRGQRRSILRITTKEQWEFTDAERTEYRTIARSQLSMAFAKKGDPRSWKNPVSQEEQTLADGTLTSALESMIDNYEAWLRGDWTDTRGVTPPPST